MEGAVYVGSELRALPRYPAQAREGEDLEAPGVGEKGQVEARHRPQAAEPLDPSVPRSQVEVVGVGQDDLGADFAYLVGPQRLDARLRPDGHEGGRRHRSAGQRHACRPGFGRRGFDLKEVHGLDPSRRTSMASP